ncbi:MAG: hypothetical protein R3F39_14240 [Myxococcota bacterium]
MRTSSLTALFISISLAACSSKPAPAPAAAPAAPAAAPVEAAKPAEAVAPAAEPAKSRGIAAPAPVSDRERNEWGKVLSETIEAGIITRKVQSPWGVISVSGPTEEPGITVVRYWTDWLRADFTSAYAYATGRMKKGLSTLDNPEGHKDYAEVIPQCYADNPVTAFSIDNVTSTSSGAATVTSTITHRDGKKEGRKTSMLLEGETWKLDFIGR